MNLTQRESAPPSAPPAGSAASVVASSRSALRGLPLAEQEQRLAPPAAVPTAVPTAVQRQEPARTAPELSPEPSPHRQRLESLLARTAPSELGRVAAEAAALGVAPRVDSDGRRLEVGPALVWLRSASALLEEVGRLGDGSAELQASETADGAEGDQLRHGGEILGRLVLWAERAVMSAFDLGRDIKQALAEAMRRTSVLASSPTAAVLPTAVEARTLRSEAERFARSGASFPLADRALVACTDASVALLQALAVESARATWSKGAAVDAPTAGTKVTPGSEVDGIFADGGGAEAGFQGELDPAKGRIHDWCGMFVMASYFRGAGIDKELRQGFLGVGDVARYFQYGLQDKDVTARAPAEVWAENRWWPLREYHAARGSLRTWTSRDQLAQALTRHQADIRAGDVVLIDHGGGDSPGHITMVESFDPTNNELVTIEGNASGIRAAADGAREQLPFGSARADTHPGARLQLRDLDTIDQPGDDRQQHGQAYKVAGGSTVFGFGRPSAVDFEEHEYSVRSVPKEYRAMSPAEMKVRGR